MPRSGFNASVHGARGLFAMMVFVYHIVHSGLRGFIPADALFSVYFLESFKFGVELFFGISGFVILGALARAPSIRSFLWDRATRIYPLLWATLSAITLLSVISHRWLPSIGDWLLNFVQPAPFISMPQINPAAWSLGYELFFYVLCATCWALRARGLSWQPLAWVVGGACLLLFPRAVLMPAGLLIASGLVSVTARRWIGAAPFFALIVFLIGWRVVDLACGGDIMTFTPVARPLARWTVLLPLAIGSAICGAAALFGIVEQRGWFTAILRTRPLQWLGAISFSFYLWHPVVMSVVKGVLIKTGITAAAGSAAQLLLALSLLPALIVAHFSQIHLEARLTRTLRRHGPRDDRGEAPVTTAALEHSPP